MVNPDVAIAVPLFRDHFVRPIEGSAGSPMFSVCQTGTDVLRPTFRVFLHGIRIFAIWSCDVWVCIPGLVNGTASATRAPCGQSP